jgi:hypothetical protein
MSMIVTVSNEAKLKKAKDLLKAKSNDETIELALEIVIREFEMKPQNSDLPEGFFEDLFAEETDLSDGESIQAIIEERRESKF